MEISRTPPYYKGGVHMDPIVDLIGNIAFPILMCLLMYKQSNEAIKNNTDAINLLIKKIEVLHGREIDD